jgi:predicted dienelactone hydrolase
VWYPALNANGLPEDVTYSYDNFATLQGFTQPGHALKDAAVDNSKGPYPLVIVSHGFASYRYVFAYLAEHLASYGFVVMVVDHTGNTLAYFADPKLAGADFSGVALSLADSLASRPSDIQRQIDYAPVLAGKGGVLDGTIDIARIAVVGHSMGGYTALASAGAQINLSPIRDWCSANANDKTATAGVRYFLLCGMLVPAEQGLLTANGINANPGEMWPPFNVTGVSAIVPISPADVFASESFKRVTIPTLLIVGTSDSFGFYKPTDSAYQNLPTTQKAMIAFENADHFFPMGRCPSWFREQQLGEACGPEPVWDLDRAHDLTNHFTTAFLLDVLKGDKDAHKTLLPDAVTFAGIQYKTTMK